MKDTSIHISTVKAVKARTPSTLRRAQCYLTASRERSRIATTLLKPSLRDLPQAARAAAEAAHFASFAQAEIEDLYRSQGK